MTRATELAAALTVVAVAAAVLLGGAFWPLQRVAVGLPLVLGAAFACRLGWPAWSPAERWGMVLVAWMAVTAVARAHDWLAARQMTAALLAAVCVAILVRRAGRARPAIELLMVAVATVVALSMVVAAVSGGGSRVAGVFDSPNLAAAVIVAALPIAWLSLPGVGLSRLVVALLLAAIAVSGSRAGALAAVVAVVLLLPRGRWRGGLIALSAIAGLAAVGWRLATDHDPMAWYRPAIWSALGRLLLRHPWLGVGPGNLADATGPIRLAHPERLLIHEHVIGTAESTFLAFALAAGLVGVLVAMVAVCAWRRELARAGDGPSPPWGRAALAAIIVMALFHDMLAAEPILWWWAAVVGLVSSPPRLPPPRRRCPWAAALAGFALLTWGLVAPEVALAWWRAGQATPASATFFQRLEPWLAEPIEWRLQALLRIPDWQWRDAAEATALAERRVSLQPGVFDAWLQLGEVAARSAVELAAWPATVARARTAFDRAAELEPHLPWPWLARARFERLIAGSRAAAPYVSQALAAEPRCAPALVLAGQVALEEGRVGEARDMVSMAEQAGAQLAQIANPSRYARDVLTIPRPQLERLRRELR